MNITIEKLSKSNMADFFDFSITGHFQTAHLMPLATVMRFT